MNLENTSSGLNTINDTTLTNDQIRAKAYRTAELLENKLDGLGTNFSLLISEVNEVSDTFNRALFINGPHKGEDSANGASDSSTALEDILILLNNHLESLNWIERSEKALAHQIETLKNNSSY
ncbi:unnamed protein product [[Candida] boidinii]|uniref:Unnamed protein product n=1 Tax=Candida boidinii TaxID=5477 RepID=A0ACB5U4W1_CANBO|nr:unnamed protein product [[Candida] boidinii]